MIDNKSCERCEDVDCRIFDHQLTMGDARLTLTPSHPWYADAVACAYRSSDLKATYKARAEAAEGKVERVRELAIEYAIHTNRKDGNYGHGIKNVLHVVANKLLEAINGK